jgi:farnesyl diphosphate synthase
MTNTVFDAYLTRHNKILRHLIETSIIPAPRIQEAMLYALFPGGKRIRPLLVYLSGELLNIQIEHLDIIAVALELTHCYSLIHDDLPAMDNDDFRRGKPSCHRAFDEATAILVGDGMQALAIELLISHLSPSLAPSQILKSTHELVKACGPSGMVSGQSLDLSELENPNISEAELKKVHHLKTGKLIAACINMVLAISHATEKQTQALQQFGHHLGLAFQMQDDYLDQYDINHLGKGRASDSANHKTTFATLHTQEDLAHLIELYYHEILDTLSIFGEQVFHITCFVQELLQRTHGLVKISKFAFINTTGDNQ